MTIHAALYSNGSNSSINDQIRTIANYAAENNIHIIQTYTDNGQYSSPEERPEFQRMLADASRGMFDVLLVETAERMSQNIYELVWYKHRLKTRNVHLRYVDTHHCSDPASRFTEQMLDTFMDYLVVDKGVGLD